MSASPSPAATATKPSGLLGSGAVSALAEAAAWSAAILAVRSWASMSMLWMKTL